MLLHSLRGTPDEEVGSVLVDRGTGESPVGARRARSGAWRFGGKPRTGMGRAVRRMGTGSSAASVVVDELETVGRRIRGDAAEQLHANGRIGIGELELPAAALPKPATRGIVEPRIRIAGVAVAGVAVDRVGVDGRIFGGVDLTANFVGKRAGVLVTVLVLLVAISHRVVIALLPAVVSRTGDLRSVARSTSFEIENGLGIDTGFVRDDSDDSSVGEYRAPVVGGADWIELGAEFAGVVPGGDREKVWRSRRAKLNTKT